MTISEALKELIVAIKGSGNEKDIKEETIADVWLKIGIRYQEG